MPKRTRTSKNSPQTSESSQRKSSQQSSPKIIVEPAIRHVGRTLESDPEYNELPSRELAPAAALISRSGNDLSASPDMRDGTDRIEGTRVSGAGPEPLRTRLPGDTSSDPHTDLGPDNATTVQHRGEEKQTKRSHRS